MPVWLIVLLALVAFFVLLFLLRVRVVLTADDAKVRLTLRVLCFTVPLYPGKRVDPRKYSPERVKKREAKKAKKAARKAAKAAKKAAKKSAKQKKPAATTKKAPKASEAPMTLTEKLTLVRKLLVALLRATGKHLYLRAARLHIRVATGDAATTAIAYGAVSGGVALILTVLGKFTVLHAAPPDVAVIADYLGEKPHIDARVVFSMRVGGAVCVLFSVAFAFLKARRAQKEKRNIAAGTPAAETSK